MNPYIGITGFRRFWQVQEMIEVFKAHMPPSSQRKLHVGVMMSYKTLHNLASSWQNIFPPKETIAAIFFSEETLNCLHYADFEGHPNLSESLAKAISWSGIGIHALQLDMTWPDPGEITKGIQASGKHIEVILQIGKNAFAQIHDDPQVLVEKLRYYEGVIDRVLLDKSMGRGLAMDAAILMPFARAVRENFPTLGIVAAGGLGPNTIHLVKPLARVFPDLSIDAQGQLRLKGNPLNLIDWGIAKAYLVKSLELLR